MRKSEVRERNEAELPPFGGNRLAGLQASCMHGAKPCCETALPPFGGNFQLGCGLVIRDLKHHRYVYFWCYETRSWGSRRVWTYVGPTSRPATRTKARLLLLEYHARVRREVDRRIVVLAERASEGP